MRRLIATLGCDVQLQLRNGFYYATAFVVVVWALLLTQAPALDMNWLLPMLLLGNLIMTTFYFIGGLVLLEKSEGTITAQVVTPLRPWEYLASKVTTLTWLALIENLIITVLLCGLGFAALPLTAGIVLASAIYALGGFVAIARYDSINAFLLPSTLYAALFYLPLLGYLNGWESWLLYLHPLQAPLLLMRAAFQPITPWQLIYGLLYATLWIVLLYCFSLQAFQRHMIAKAGGM